MSITSPCINVCVTDPDTDLCYGCSRTTKEIKECSKYNDESIFTDTFELGNKGMKNSKKALRDSAYTLAKKIGK